MFNVRCSFFCILIRRPPHEVNHHLGKRFALVVLEEVSATLYDGVRLPLGAGHALLKNLLAAAGDGITVAESGEEGLFELG
jgi:hypothetical protein